LYKQQAFLCKRRKEIVRRDLRTLDKLEAAENKEKEAAENAIAEDKVLEAELLKLDPNFDFSSFDVAESFPAWPEHNNVLVVQGT